MKRKSVSDVKVVPVPVENVEPVAPVVVPTVAPVVAPTVQVSTNIPVKKTRARKVVPPTESVKVVETPVVVPPSTPVELPSALPSVLNSDLTSVLPSVLANTTIQDNLEVVEEENVEGNDVSDETKQKRIRKSLSKNSFVEAFDSFVESFGEFYENLREDKNTKLPKTNYLKKLKQIQNDAYKLIKIKNSTDKKIKNESNSGFMKPIRVSKELASFLGFEQDAVITRVDVTKKLCQYIREKDLQNPSDRREINPDEQLKHLFNITERTEDDKLTYYSMQKKLQNHIFKI
jgi:chromatin remodeling complex protein RSC6